MIERVLERLIFLSRWLMAPFYIGLIGVLALLLVKFLQELWNVLPRIMDLSDIDVILMALSLLDITLAASLILMMVFSGYESFVSRLDAAAGERPAWMGTLDFSGLKLKLIASIVAISGIDLLKKFMNIELADKTNMMWLVITHLTFVISGVLLALMDYLTERAKKLHDEP
jgi:uncharacterized protein (TIGR00645 family)